MSRKNSLLKYQTITGGAMANTDVLTSVATNIQYLDDIGIQFNFSGSPTGTFQTQVSVDHVQDAQGNVVLAGNWVPLVMSYWNGSAFVTGTTIPTSVGSPIYLDLALLSAPWIRTVYTNASGTGVLNAFITAKGLA